MGLVLLKLRLNLTLLRLHLLLGLLSTDRCYPIHLSGAISRGLAEAGLRAGPHPLDPLIVVGVLGVVDRVGVLLLAGPPPLTLRSLEAGGWRE